MTPRRNIVVLSTASLALLAIGGLIVFGSCSQSNEHGHGPTGTPDDAGVSGDSAPEGGATCNASTSSSSYAVPSNVPGWSIEFDGITCTHPDIRSSCADGWCQLPAGCFVMGSPESEWGRGATDEDQVAVTLTHSFAIQQNEVTVAQWTAVGFTDPTGPLTNGDAGPVGGECDDPSCPAASMSWFEAAAFANAMSAKDGLPSCYVLSNCTGKVGEGMKCDSASLTTATTYACQGYRLPTSAEWEYAARAGTRTPFYSGDVSPQANIVACCNENSLNGVSWYCANSGGWTHPVGQKLPNAWGLYDILGNATEWVSDPYTGSTPTGPVVDRGGDLGAQLARIARGGSAPLSVNSDRAACVDVGFTWDFHPHGLGFGLRLVRTVGTAGGGD